MELFWSRSWDYFHGGALKHEPSFIKIITALQTRGNFVFGNPFS